MEKAAAYAGTLQEHNVGQHRTATAKCPYRDPEFLTSGRLDPRGVHFSVHRTVTFRTDRSRVITYCRIGFLERPS